MPKIIGTAISMNGFRNPAISTIPKQKSNTYHGIKQILIITVVFVGDEPPTKSDVAAIIKEATTKGVKNRGAIMDPKRSLLARAESFGINLSVSNVIAKGKYKMYIAMVSIVSMILLLFFMLLPLATK